MERSSGNVGLTDGNRLTINKAAAKNHKTIELNQLLCDTVPTKQKHPTAGIYDNNYFYFYFLCALVLQFIEYVYCLIMRLSIICKALTCMKGAIHIKFD